MINLNLETQKKVLLTGVAVVVSIPLILLLIEWSPEIWQRLKPSDTYGTIYVDTPEVYTRERLVNDRFLQEAWLNGQLRRTDALMKDGKFDSVDVRRVNRAASALQLAMALSIGKDREPIESMSLSDAINETAKEAEASIVAAPIDAFHDAQAYRGIIRAELMRTQLDDRHDIEGNTLYRLNFDATIAPGSNTKSSALIRVILDEGDKARLLHYMNLYADWHRQLQGSIDRAIVAQTNDILVSERPLPGYQRIAFQSFISDELCEGMREIVEIAGFPKNKSMGSNQRAVKHSDEDDEDADDESERRKSGCAMLASYFDERVLEAFRKNVGRYLSSYLQSVSDRNSERYAKRIFGMLGSTLSGLPSGSYQEFCSKIRYFASEICSSEQNFEGPSQREKEREIQTMGPREPYWRKVVRFAKSQKECSRLQKVRSNDADGKSKAEDQGSDRTFVLELTKLPDKHPPITISCPPEIRAYEPLVGALPLEQFLRSFVVTFDEQTLIGLKESAKHQRERFVELVVCNIMLRKLPSGSYKCGDDAELAKIGQKKDLYSRKIKGPPRVSDEMVRGFVAKFVKAKLNGKLASHPSVPPLSSFFDTDVEGCELKLCTLMLKHKVPADSTPAEHEQACKALEGEISGPEEKNGDGSDRQAGSNKSKQAESGIEEEQIELPPPYNCEVVNNLRNKLQVNAKVFSYAVTPTEMVQRIANEDSMRTSLHASIQAAIDKGNAGFADAYSRLKEFENSMEMRHRSPLVVGFGTPFRQSKTEKVTLPTQVGWVVRPRLVPGSFKERQIAQHHSLAAVISVPSWWRSLKIVVISEWVNDDNIDDLDDLPPVKNCKDAEEQLPKIESCNVYYVEIPGSVKEINEKLRYEVRKEPYIDGQSTILRGDQFLEIGRRGQIILEGGRLWRSTVVTVGQQQADEIVVLPDMDGVVAKFECVKPPPGTSGWGISNAQSVQRVTVWTSEGSTTTPFVVHFKPFQDRTKRSEGGNREQESASLKGEADQPTREAAGSGNSENPPKNSPPDREEDSVPKQATHNHNGEVDQPCYLKEDIAALTTRG